MKKAFSGMNMGSRGPETAQYLGAQSGEAVRVLVLVRVHGLGTTDAVRGLLEDARGGTLCGY